MKKNAVGLWLPLRGFSVMNFSNLEKRIFVFCSKSAFCIASYIYYLAYNNFIGTQNQLVIYLYHGDINVTPAILFLISYLVIYYTFKRIFFMTMKFVVRSK